MIWTDQTTYKRGDTERIPTTWHCALTDKVSFLVHKHIYYGDAWLLTCNYLGVERLDLGTTELESAKARATLKMRDLLNKKKAEINAAISELLWPHEGEIEA